MRTFLCLGAMAFCLLVHEAVGGERIIGSGCRISTTDGGIASSAADAGGDGTNCVWKDGQWLTLQCDGGVFYSKDGTTPSAATSPYVATGDPYPIASQRSSAVNPVQVLPAAGGAVSCNIFASDSL